MTRYRSFFHELRAHRSPALSAQEDLYLHNAWFELVARVMSHNMTLTFDRRGVILGSCPGIPRWGTIFRVQVWFVAPSFPFRFIVVRRIKTNEEINRVPERSWSWQSVDGEIDISHESLVVGKERAWMKAVELVTQEAENSTACDESEEKYHLILIGPLYRCTNNFPSHNQRFISELQTPEGRVEATFWILSTGTW
jgi:hypothetical protein